MNTAHRTVIAVIGALTSRLRRHEKTKRRKLDGPTLTAVKYGISVHEELIRNNTPMQIIEELRQLTKCVTKKEVVS